MRCPRCGSCTLQEPFEDPGGSGQVRLCLSCGDRQETYTSRPAGYASVEEQRRLFDEDRRVGRPRKYHYEG